MRQNLSLRLLVALLGLFPILLVFSACMSAGPQRSAACPDNPQNPAAPVICVDDSNPFLHAYPNPVNAHKIDHGKQIPIHWVAPGKHWIHITVAPAGDGVNCVVEQPTCNGAECKATINPDAGGRQCKYTVSVPNEPYYKVNDPIIIVDNCCPD